MGANDRRVAPFAPESAAFRAARGVRLFHACVRHQLRNTDPRWPEAAVGAPVNQEDLLATLAVFTVVVIDALHSMGAQISDTDVLGYVHTWLVVGYVLGIDYECLFKVPDRERDVAPLNYEELRAFLQRYSDRRCGFSLSGTRLAHALVEVQKKRFLGPLKQLPAASMRYFIGDVRADQLSLPSPRGFRFVFAVMKRFTIVRTWACHTRLIAWFLRRRTYGLYRIYIRGEHGDRPPWRIDQLTKRLPSG
jgi:hypothetical protein